MALDGWCDVQTAQRDTYRTGVMTSGLNYARMWRVEIWRRDDREWSKVIAEGADLAGVPEVAVRGVEEKFGGL